MSLCWCWHWSTWWEVEVRDKMGVLPARFLGQGAGGGELTTVILRLVNNLELKSKFLECVRT